MIRNVAKKISLPALLLDLDAFDDNCRQIADKANGKKIRIATKSIRSVGVLRRILESDSVFQGLMCYSSKEAVFLANKGFNNILIGYPCTDKESLKEISLLTANGHAIICMADCDEHIELLEAVAEETNGKFSVCIDVDMSTKFPFLHFGVRRSPLQSGSDVVHLAHKIKNSKHVELKGIMGYEAQIAGVGDDVPNQNFKNRFIAFLKKKSRKTVEMRRKNVVDALRKEGFVLEFVNGGGTGSLHTTTTDDVVTEVTVGSGFYSPLLFDYYRDFHYKPSLYFALPVVRKPTENIYTCLGGGYIASGPAGKDKAPQPVYPPNGQLLKFEGAGEVQTPVYFEHEHLEIGDPIIFRHAKAGEICERFNEIICFKNGEIVSRFPTYRGEGVSFL